MSGQEPVENTNGLLVSLERIAQVLGFHDLTSFFVSVVFLIAALAFVFSCGVFFFKKRREQKKQILESVLKVQAEFVDQEKPTEDIMALKTVKPVARHTPETAMPAQEEKPVAVEDAKTSLGTALKNTRAGFMSKISSLFTGRVDISDQDFEKLEEILFTADIGVKTASKLLTSLQNMAKSQKNVSEGFLHDALKKEMKKILLSAEQKPQPWSSTPTVILFVGVNGAGKTTSIGKLGAQLKSMGKNVVFGAGDTFRAAAVTQLKLWGERIGATVVCGKEKSDSASVLFETIAKAKEEHADFALCDTAGRLHTKTELMEELGKVYKVIGKALPGAPHEVFLVVDATMGQNAIAQAREFAAVAPLSGVVLSKLDGTAKGGVAFGIVDELKTPIRYVGIGEKASDLKAFDADEFVDALFLEK